MSIVMALTGEQPFVAPVTSHKTVLYQAVSKSESCSAKSISCSWVGLYIVSHKVPLLQQLQVKQPRDIMTWKFKTKKFSTYHN